MNKDPYAEMRWTPRFGEGLYFDERYRAAHLPHVAPEHPRTLDRWSGGDHRHGRYDRARVSLVADLGRVFLAHAACRRLLEGLASSSFSEKVAFDLIEVRAPNLHCTLVGDISPAAHLRNDANKMLRAAPSFAPLLHGPFIGQFNRGRIYLPLEFDRAADRRTLEAVSAVFGTRRQTFTAIGLVNLREELDPGEAKELVGILTALKETRERLPLRELSWTSTHDDLTLDMRRLETITLGTAGNT